MTKWEHLLPHLLEGDWNALKVRDAIIETSLPRSVKDVVNAIVSHHSTENPRPSVGLRRLADLCSMKVDTVVAAVAEAERLGLFRVDRRQHQAHSYDLSTLRQVLATHPPAYVLSQKRVQRVSRSGGLAVPIGGTAGVPKEGTQSPVPASEVSRSGVHEVSRSGDGGVPIQGVGCPDRGNPRDMEVTHEGTQQQSARVRDDATRRPLAPVVVAGEFIRCPVSLPIDDETFSRLELDVAMPRRVAEIALRDWATDRAATQELRRLDTWISWALTTLRRRWSADKDGMRAAAQQPADPSEKRRQREAAEAAIGKRQEADLRRLCAQFGARVVAPDDVREAIGKLMEGPSGPLKGNEHA